MRRENSPESRAYAALLGTFLTVLTDGRPTTQKENQERELQSSKEASMGSIEETRITGGLVSGDGKLRGRILGPRAYHIVWRLPDGSFSSFCVSLSVGLLTL